MTWHSSDSSAWSEHLQQGRAAAHIDVALVVGHGAAVLAEGEQARQRILCSGWEGWGMRAWVLGGVQRDLLQGSNSR